MNGLTERSAIDLASAIRRRELTSTEVLDGHIQLLEATGPQINAIVANRYDAARERAQEIDQWVARDSMRGASEDEFPPLLGVPFTVRESIAVEDMPNSAGVPARREHRAGRTAPAVQRLMDAGAIPIAVTNTSGLSLWIESENPVYGRTNNPYDHTRTAGGSSGGEAAAVGSGGSPFGVAADIGGSIRIPALFCGVFGHKPSAGLIPTTGQWPTTAGDAARMLAVGPMARRAEDLMPLLQVMAGPDGRDPISVPMELGDPSSVSLDGLQVTVVENSSIRSMSRDIRDARERAVGALVAVGARVQRLDLQAWRGALLPYLAALRETGEDSSGTASPAVEGGDGLRELLFGSGQHRLPTKLTALAEAVPGNAGVRDKLLARARELADRLTEAIGSGVLVHPAQLTVAPRHRQTYARPWLTTPASIFNLTGVPVTEVPLGLTEAGLPVGVQVAAAHGADHLSIAIALELEAVFGGWVPPPA
jgi:fatty acid amide hydrolase 2